MDMEKDLLVVLICISLTPRVFSCAYWPLAHLLQSSVYLSLMFLFKDLIESVPSPHSSKLFWLFLVLCLP